jgi:hypothetical protein
MNESVKSKKNRINNKSDHNASNISAGCIVCRNHAKHATNDSISQCSEWTRGGGTKTITCTYPATKTVTFACSNPDINPIDGKCITKPGDRSEEEV